MRGRRNKDKPLFNPALPPCRVCGEPGSGFHYGTTTCGACKGFFRRCLVRKEPYVCIQSDLCHVGPNTKRRQSCPKCRYDKCISVGMSKDACKVGRYSLVKKSTDLMAVLEHNQIKSSEESTGSDGANINMDRQNYNKTVTQTPIVEGFKTYPSRNSAHVESPKRVQFSDVSSDIDDDSQETTGEYSSDEEMKWFEEEYRGNSEHGLSPASASSFPDSNKSLSFNSSVCMENDYDESLSLSSCLLSTVCEDKVASETTIPNTKNEFEPNCSAKTEPLYTLVESHKSNVTTLDTPDTTRHGPCLHMDSFTSYSPDSRNTIPVAQHITSIPATAAASPYSHSSTGETSCSVELNHAVSPQYAQINNSGNPPFHSTPSYHNMMAAHQPSFSYSQQPILRNYQTSQLEFTPITTLSEEPFLPNERHDSKTLMASSIKEVDIDYCFETKNRMDDASVHNHESILDMSHATNSGIITRHSTNSHVINETSNLYPPLQSPDGTLCMPSNNSWGSTEVGVISHAVINNPKRKNDNHDDNERPHKIANLLQSQELVSCMQLSSKTPASQFVLLLSTEAPNDKSSLFDRCTYTSFERKSLAPLLKHSLDCFPFGAQRPNKILEFPTTSLELNSYTSVNDTSLISTLAKDPSPELQEYTCSLTYDSQEMDVLYSQLMEVNARYFGNKSSFMSESDIKGAQEKFWGMCQLRDMVHGKMKFIEDDKYFTILDATGIDVDNRKEWLLTYLGKMELHLSKVIRFFRSVNGFNSFVLADKITLTKSNLCAYTVVTSHRGYDENTSIVIDDEKETALRVNIFSELVPNVRDIHKNILEVCSAMKSLSLTYEEIALVKALVITTPNPGDVLKEPEKVDECHKRYQKCLLNHCRKMHGVLGDNRFAKIFRVLQGLNELRGGFVVLKKETTSRFARLIEDSSLRLVKESCFDFDIVRPSSAVEG